MPRQHKHRPYVPPKDFIPVLIDWYEFVFLSKIPLKEPGCDWITDESIKECLKVGHLEDTTVPQVRHKSHHSARIADLVVRLEAGEVLDPIHINANTRLSIYDGSHRLRAYQFVSKTRSIPAILTGKHAKRLARTACISSIEGVTKT
jgi:hypothetical protein